MAAIILVRPQMGENIGAAARAMKNFGFDDLRLVSPRDPWPNPKAEMLSCDGIDIIKNTKIFNSLTDACFDINYLYATSARKRSMNKNVTVSRELRLRENIGIIFGPENSGLSNHEISLADEIVTIDTSNLKSLNLAQAVLVVCYDLFMNIDKKSEIENLAQNLCSKKQLGQFLDMLFKKLDDRNFYKVEEKKPIMQNNIANIFTRIPNLSENELQTLYGIILSNDKFRRESNKD